MRLTLKLVLAFQALLILLAVLIILPLKDRMVEQVVVDIQNEARAIVTTAALQIDGDAHANIMADTPADDATFVALREQLRAVMGANHLTPDNIYTFYFSGKGVLRFAVMAHPEGSEFIGDVYEAKEHLLRAVDTGQPQVSKLYADDYGQWISAAAPIFNRDGVPVGLIEVNRSFDEYADRYWAVALSAIITGAVGLTVATIIMAVVIHWVLVRPLRVIHRGMLALGDQRFDEKVTLKTGDELEDLAATLSSLFTQLNAAKRVQQSFFPKRLPDRDGLRFAGKSDPCDAAGGDYFDAFEIGGGRTAMLLADVSGHGLGSAMIMASCRAIVHALASSGFGPAELIDKLEQLMEKDLVDGRFITMIYAVIDADNRMTYTNAGHAPAMIVKRASHEGGNGASRDARQLPAHRPPVGIAIPLDDERETTLQLEPGDSILFTSDGVNEAQDPSDEQFGTKRIEVIVSNASLECHQVIERLNDELTAHRRERRADDDVTMLCVDCVG